MNRRAALTTVILAATAIPAFAQTPKDAALGPMGDAETKHTRDTMRVGSLSLLTSRIAVKKAKNAAVKQFAQFEVAEQETIAEVLKSIQNTSATTSGQAPSDTEVEAMLDEKGKGSLKKLQDAEAGDAFDKEYVTAQIDGHKQLLSFQETYIRGGKNREHLNTAKLARGQINEHLVLLNSAKG